MEPARSDSVTGQAREEAGQLKDTSVDVARDVAGTVKDKAFEVTADAREQTRRLAGQTRDQLVDQAGQQKENAADGLRSLSEELRGMAEHGQGGWGAQLANHGAELSSQAADFLQKHEPGDLLEEVRLFARRKPGTFLLAAAAAGVLAGRVTRALAAGTPDAGSSGRRTAELSPMDEDYLVPPPAPAPLSAGPVVPTPEPRFGPGSER